MNIQTKYIIIIIMRIKENNGKISLNNDKQSKKKSWCTNYHYNNHKYTWHISSCIPPMPYHCHINIKSTTTTTTTLYLIINNNMDMMKKDEQKEYTDDRISNFDNKNKKNDSLLNNTTETVVVAHQPNFSNDQKIKDESSKLISSPIQNKIELFNKINYDEKIKPTSHICINDHHKVSGIIKLDNSKIIVVVHIITKELHKILIQIN